MTNFAKMVKKVYHIKRKGITTRNPQANAILERVHKTIGDIIRTFEVYDSEIENEDDVWAGVLSATMFAIQATCHTTLQATPTQLVFGRDAILDIEYQANWDAIKNRKQLMIHKNNQRENAARIPYTYQVNEKVLYKKVYKSKFGEAPFKGPYKIVQVNDNGTVHLRMGPIVERVNIRLIKPYKE